MRRSESAIWSASRVSPAYAGSTKVSVARNRTISVTLSFTPSSLFGEVLERVRSDYVEK